MKTDENERDAKRVGVWLAVVIGALVVGAIVFNVFWYKRPPANVDNKPAASSPAPASEKPSGS
ncbi:hypothetical protein ACSFA0_24560 [Variovorax sp. LT1P1]|uniref:hypothetical protein n=1 Tax=Variovorax sp. LT1P1 TaxID=3443730 RepID=UPI003F48355A